jgi:3-isopropylmalate/(R)-2-methylmalate dehydratase small subunit
VAVDESTHGWLIDHPGAEVTIDVASATLTLPTGARIVFPIETFARYCLVNGIDELGFLLEHQPQIEEFERRRRAA